MRSLSDRYIVIDSGIPFIKGVFEPFCNVLYSPASEFDSEIWWIKRHVPNARIALIIRTRTKCDAKLLRSSGVDFIATATIGTDHIDIEFCKQESIKVFNAAGCNSGGVMQYVFTSLAYASKNAIEHNLSNPSLKNDLLNKLYNTLFSEGKSRNRESSPTIGVIGVGNVGSKVVDIAKKIGWNVIANDPPKEHLHPEYSPLNELLAKSDIVTLHIPLDSSTHNFANEKFFSLIKPGAIFINTSRGEVVDEKALLESKNVSGYIIDVWKNEPNINLELMENSLIATPHIAGYSKEGKENGSQMVVRAVAEYLGIKELSNFTANPSPSYNYLNIDDNIGEQLLSFFDISDIDKKLRSTPKDFEALRNKFKLRSEYILSD